MSRVDRYGVFWALSSEELCSACGQVDPYEDCDHTQIPARAVRVLGGIPITDARALQCHDAQGLMAIEFTGDDLSARGLLRLARHLDVCAPCRDAYTRIVGEAVEILDGEGMRH